MKNNDTNPPNARTPISLTPAIFSPPSPNDSDASPPNASDSEPPPHTIFTNWQRAVIVVIVSLAATFSGFASNIYFPALPTIASDLSVSIELINLTVTSYMVFQGITPTFWGAIADTKGRRVTYIGTFLVFLAACVSLANIKTYSALLVLRCLQSTGSASTIAIGAGVIGDITTRQERGGLMGIFQAGLLVPLAIGPVLGGAFAKTLGWRAIFWFLAIYSGVFLLLLICFLPETLKSIVGNGSKIPGQGLITKYPLAWYVQLSSRRYDLDSPSTSNDPLPNVSSSLHLNSIPKPATNRLLSSLQILLAKQARLIIIFLSIFYTIWQMSIVVMSTLFKTIYGLSDISIGLTFIANGVGSMLGTLVTGKLLDIDYERVLIKFGCEEDGKRDMLLEHARLRTIWFWAVLQATALLVFGWTLDKHIHIAVPMMSTFFTGWAATSIQSIVTTYLVDSFPDRSASASAALNLARCLMGAAGISAAMPIINGIGAGWTFTILAAIMCFAMGLLVLQMKFAPRRRRESSAG